jgi:ketosteroid isomerase-like protein
MPVPHPAITAIQSARQLNNRRIATRDVAGLRAQLTDDILLLIGDGGLIDGADAVVGAFKEQFKDPDFDAYVRTNERVEVADTGLRAAEQGRWVGRWRSGMELAGTYLAGWRLVHGRWLIEREMYVTLTRTDPTA